MARPRLDRITSDVRRRAMLMRRSTHSDAAVAGKFCLQPPGPFKDDVRLLAAVVCMIRLRIAWLTSDASERDARDLETVALAERLRRWVLRSIRLSGPEVRLAALVRKARLNQAETEILLALVVIATGLVAGPGDGREVTVGDIQDLAGATTARRIAVLRALAASGRLTLHGLVYVASSDVTAQTDLELSEDVTAAVVDPSRTIRASRDTRTEDDLRRTCRDVVRTMQDVGSCLDAGRWFGSRGGLTRALRQRDRLLLRLEHGLAVHPMWGLARVRKELESATDLAVVVFLQGRELGHVADAAERCKGAWLANAASRHGDDADDVLDHLGKDAPLRAGGWVRACAGSGDSVAVEDAATLGGCEFELTKKALETLGIRGRARKRAGIREPLVRMDQLTLPERVRSAVEMALVQVRHRDRLFGDWGLGAAVPYGRGVTLLFSGPPGTGKTATAEAMASELGLPILVANVAENQSCWVGETEKAIVRTFREAAEGGAVLFFDEADSLFHAREAASRQFEVRDVNVLLQEVERFEGVCILATNRKTHLDAALERRVTLKVEFDLPDEAARLAIWRSLVPPQMPLAADVDVPVLARHDLTGGQIKNAVLNAARRALQRGGAEARVSHDDFLDAIRFEAEGSWSRVTRMGFESVRDGRRSTLVEEVASSAEPE